MEITKKYIDITENNHDNNNALCVRIYYDLGGYNFYTHKEKARGYYISVTPVQHTTRDGVTMETFTAFTGFCDLLQDCTRKSKKAEAAALKKAPAYETMIIDHLVNKYGYVLEV